MRNVPDTEAAHEPTAQSGGEERSTMQPAQGSSSAQCRRGVFPFVFPFGMASARLVASELLCGRKAEYSRCMNRFKCFQFILM